MDIRRKFFTQGGDALEHVPWSHFQEDLLCNHSQHRGEPDMLIVPRVILFIHNNRCAVAFFLLTRDFT